MSEIEIKERINKCLFVEGLKYRGVLNAKRVSLIGNPNFPASWDDVAAVAIYRNNIRESVEARIRAEYNT